MVSFPPDSPHFAHQSLRRVENCPGRNAPPSGSPLRTRGAPLPTRLVTLSTRSAPPPTRGALLPTRGSLLPTRLMPIPTRSVPFWTRGAQVRTRGSEEATRGASPPLSGSEAPPPGSASVLRQTRSVQARQQCVQPAALYPFRGRSPRARGRGAAVDPDQHSDRSGPGAQELERGPSGGAPVGGQGAQPGVGGGVHPQRSRGVGGDAGLWAPGMPGSSTFIKLIVPEGRSLRAPTTRSYSSRSPA
jgi:hypothetical protein